MSLENKLRVVSIASTVGAATIFTNLSYYCFSHGYKFGGLMSAISIAGTAGLIYLSYKHIGRSSKSEETGFFGVPDRDISDLERENHKRRGTVN